MTLDEYYWGHVKPVGDKSQCLIWTGPYHTKRRTRQEVPRAFVNGAVYTAYQLAWVVDGGLASDGPFVPTCKTPGCVYVGHLRMKWEDPLLDERQYGRRLEDGFRMIQLSDDDNEE